LFAVLRTTKNNNNDKISGKVGNKSLTHTEVQLMIKFIDNYAEANAMVSYCDYISSFTCIMVD